MKTLVDKHLTVGLVNRFQVLSIKIIILKFCLQMYILPLLQYVEGNRSGDSCFER